LDPPEIQIRFGHPVPVTRINHEFDPGKTKVPAPRELAACKEKLRENDDLALVIVGVIDDGLPFAHENFFESDAGSSTSRTTRIDYCWLQGSDSRSANALTIADDKAVAFGKELTGAAIDKLIVKHGADEDDIYADQTSGAMTSDPDTARNIFQAYTHGAHVMETACGFKPEDEGYDDRDAVRIVGVQLPRTALQDTSGFGKEPFILSAVHYILDRASRIAAKVKAEDGLKDRDVVVLINLSLGITGGPKNGKSLIERTLDDTIEAFVRDSTFREVKIFLPSGNNYASQMATEVDLNSTNRAANVEWHIQPNDRTPSFVEFWFDSESDISQVANFLSLSLVSPNGTEINFPKGNVQAGRWIIEPIKLGETVIGQMSLDRSADRYRFMIILAPTEYDQGDVDQALPIVPPGTWLVKFWLADVAKNDAIKLQGVIQRDEDPAGTGTGGRQSYFGTTPSGDKKDVYRTHDEMGRRIAQVDHTPSAGKFSISGFRTINGWATKNGTTSRHSVAGFTGAKNLAGNLIALEPATYSAAGSRDASEPKIDSSALSNRSIVLSGVAGSGTRSGSTQILVGTSAASPSRLRNYLLDMDWNRTDVTPQEAPKDLRLGHKSFGQRERRDAPSDLIASKEAPVSSKA